MNLSNLLTPENLGVAWVLVGLVGSALEAIGEKKNWPKLVALGQRLESASIDLPKLVRGSRATAMQKGDEGPKTARTGGAS